MAAKRSRATPCQRAARADEIGVQALQQTVLLFAQIQRGSLLVNGIEPGQGSRRGIATLLSCAASSGAISRSTGLQGGRRLGSAQVFKGQPHADPA